MSLVDCHRKPGQIQLQGFHSSQLFFLVAVAVMVVAAGMGLTVETGLPLCFGCISTVRGWIEKPQGYHRPSTKTRSYR